MLRMVPDRIRVVPAGGSSAGLSAVREGRADAGLAVRAAAVELDLEFLPLAWEDYEIAVPAVALGAASDLVAVLRTDALRAAVQALGGYDTSQSGRVTALGPATR